MRFNNVSTNTYAYNYSINGAAYSASLSASFIILQPNAASESYAAYSDVTIWNSASEFKVAIGKTIDVFGSDATTGNNINEYMGKWASTAQVTRIDVINGGAGDFAIGSEVIVLGHD